jgi:hypothetical protein
MSAPANADIKSNDIGVNFSLTGNGVAITNHWLAVPIEGTFYPSSLGEPEEKHLTIMPLHREDGDIV